MTKYVLDEYDGPELDYSTLGFRASVGDILSATGAPDARWSVNGDQGAAETVDRYTIGQSDPSYVEPTDGHFLAYSDADNAYVPVAPETAVAAVADDITASRINDDASATAAALSATVAQLKAWAKNPDLLIVGALTYASGLLTSAAVVWPDGATGTLTITSRSSAGDVTGYAITRVVGAVTTTYTQPTITRDASGNATNVPQITVA